MEDSKETTNEELARMIKVGFDHVDERFEQVDKRFEQVDEQLKQIKKDVGIIKTQTERRDDYAVDRIEEHEKRITVIEEKLDMKPTRA